MGKSKDSKNVVNKLRQVEAQIRDQSEKIDDNPIHEAINYKYEFGSPEDTVEKMLFFLNFISDIQGEVSNGIVLTSDGQEGFRFLLDFFSDTLKQIQKKIEP